MLRITFVFLVTVVLAAGVPLDCSARTFTSCKTNNLVLDASESGSDAAVDFHLGAGTSSAAGPATTLLFAYYASGAARMHQSVPPNLASALSAIDGSFRSIERTCRSRSNLGMSCFATGSEQLAVLRRPFAETPFDRVSGGNGYFDSANATSDSASAEAGLVSSPPLTLTSVPEPWTLLMVGGGLILLGTVRRGRPQ